jgi:hypothetical protein
MDLVPFQREIASAWDDLVGDAPMGTFLHTRRFLAYHGDRFVDHSWLIYQDDRLVGVLPAAVDPADARRVVSHPGATFGGIVHSGRLVGDRMIDALAATRRLYAEHGFSSFRYKAVPWIYHTTPSEDDRYALFRAGASPVRVDLSCSIDLADRRGLSTRRRRGLRKATAAGVEVSDSFEHVAALWRILVENLDARPA